MMPFKFLIWLGIGKFLTDFVPIISIWSKVSRAATLDADELSLCDGWCFNGDVEYSEESLKLFFDIVGYCLGLGQEIIYLGLLR